MIVETGLAPPMKAGSQEEVRRVFFAVRFVPDPASV